MKNDSVSAFITVSNFFRNFVAFKVCGQPSLLKHVYNFRCKNWILQTAFE